MVFRIACVMISSFSRWPIILLCSIRCVLMALSISGKSGMIKMLAPQEHLKIGILLVLMLILEFLNCILSCSLAFISITSHATSEVFCIQINFNIGDNSFYKA